PTTFSKGFTVNVTLSDGRVMTLRGGVGQTARRGRILAMPALQFEDDSFSPVLYSTDNTFWLPWRYAADGTTPSTLSYPNTADRMLYFKNNPTAKTPGLTLAHLQSLHDTFMKNGNSGDNLSATAVSPIGFDLSATTYESTTLPQNIFTRYGEATARFSTDLRYVSLPQNIAVIPSNAFYGNQVIRTIVLPASVREIGTYAFDMSRGFSNTADGGVPASQGIFCYATTPPTLGAGVFSYTNPTFHVPAASLAAYQEVWTNNVSSAQTNRATLVGDL
uniref:leucine-rich repeat protein n=1 Tax=Alistipes sp. TaxID=1872444 RepID=UPI003AF0C62E